MLVLNDAPQNTEAAKPSPTVAEIASPSQSKTHVSLFGKGRKRTLYKLKDISFLLLRCESSCVSKSNCVVMFKNKRKLHVPLVQKKTHGCEKPVL